MAVEALEHKDFSIFFLQISFQVHNGFHLLISVLFHTLVRMIFTVWLTVLAFPLELVRRVY
jgi:hypothetical protein